MNNIFISLSIQSTIEVRGHDDKRKNVLLWLFACHAHLIILNCFSNGFEEKEGSLTGIDLLFVQ